MNKFDLNYCLACSQRIKPHKPLAKSLQKIHQKNQKINLQLQRLIDQSIDQKYPDHDQ